MAQMKIDSSGTMVTVVADEELPVVYLQFDTRQPVEMRESEAREMASMLLDAASEAAR